ncbi:alpha-hydroxy acid oxidase [Pollutimonas harenae]|uniref:Alpha-hydroxy-acid oxidizing protein n=1 Tax=Pollutimonas harenae TaxID=657015 RepID=A0A853H195_9BURK|nr:alpha-hydroxy acid oxidase [Pollutimonas harenae]NYT85800.1 alpha-hydroxy-acid oxidizing protein [Pollutimonas harenae]TEA70863.1 alpha-hydroxy-acid oxidizing protein [Pollutimonas harenae]
MSRLLDCLCLEDFERQARRTLPRPLYGYIRATAEDGISYKNNVDAFRRYAFVQRSLIDVSARHTDSLLFDHQYSQPFGIAPMGLSALYTYRGDIVLAQAAANHNIPMIVSSSSLIPMELIARHNPQAWFQAYVPGETDKLEALVERILNAGFRTLVITVDTPVNPNKQNYLRYGFSSPLKLTPQLLWQGISHPRWLANTFLPTVLKHGIPHFENNYATRGVAIISRKVERDFSDRGKLNWHHIRHIRELWRHNLIIKGLQDPTDVVKAVDHGVDGVILSNHGGRQLDSVVSPLQLLPQVVSRCPSIPIMMDGGIRRGSDVIKCLALGARMVFVGRPFAYAAATGGRAGVDRAAELLSLEIDRNLAMLGVPNIAGLGPDCLIKQPGYL